MALSAATFREAVEVGKIQRRFGCQVHHGRRNRRRQIGEGDDTATMDRSVSKWHHRLGLRAVARRPAGSGTETGPKAGIIPTLLIWRRLG